MGQWGGAIVVRGQLVLGSWCMVVGAEAGKQDAGLWWRVWFEGFRVCEGSLVV